MFSAKDPLFLWHLHGEYKVLQIAVFFFLYFYDVWLVCFCGVLVPGTLAFPLVSPRLVAIAFWLTLSQQSCGDIICISVGRRIGADTGYTDDDVIGQK